MTSRTTPVGLFVIALAGLFAVGCTTQTGAVFDALLDPAGTSESALEVENADDAARVGSASVSPWVLPDWVSMELPVGWSGVAVGPTQQDQIVAAIGATHPELADRISGVLDETDARLSAVAADRTADGEVELLVVITQPVEGRRPHALKNRVRGYINELPGLADGPLSPHDALLPGGKAHRFDYSIDDPDAGELRVRSYLKTYSGQAYLINFVASESGADEADAVFDAIAESLRFGI